MTSKMCNKGNKAINESMVIRFVFNILIRRLKNKNRKSYITNFRIKIITYLYIGKVIITMFLITISINRDVNQFDQNKKHI